MPPVLIGRLEAGWHPGEPEPVAVSAQESLGETRARHYLYFRDEATARRAAAKVQDDGMRAEVELSPGAVEWVVRASGEVETLAETSANLENLAATLGGEYDGWETG